MLKAFAAGLLITSLLVSVDANNNGYSRCNCEEEGFFSADNILECQRVSDFLIAVAYFSIPIELLYFVSCSNVPFKWVLFEFIAFIVLCGMTHLLNGWTYGSHPFQLMLALTIFKLLTALVSCATAITLITLIPLLLKVKVREFMLRKKTWDLGREVGLIKKKKETGLHVRMLTQEIRKSLDRHTILDTTLVELSEALDLQNCAVWMPNESKTEMNLTRELNGRNVYNRSIDISYPDVKRIKATDGVNILSPDSALGVASSGGSGEAGAVAAIRMPMLRVSNFKGGTPETIQACYAILVLVLPSEQGRSWANHELEIVQVVADQVAVALSHAAVLEESQIMREKLAEQNRALQQARKDAMMANQARNSFQKVMSNGMRRPMHTVSGLLSVLQDDNLGTDQQIIVDAMVKSSDVLSTLINDLMDVSLKNNGRFPLDMKSFRLHSMIREATYLAKCLCLYLGFHFSIEAEKSLPGHVIGDEKRVFQVILHMFGNLLNSSNEGGSVKFRIFREKGSRGTNDQRWATWRSNFSDECIRVRFEISVSNTCSVPSSSSSTLQFGRGRLVDGRVDEDLSFSMCKNLVQLMQGNIWIVPSSQGVNHSMSLVVPFQTQQPMGTSFLEFGEASDQPDSNTLLRGLQVLLVDEDNVNRAVTQRLLEKLGCQVTTVSSGFECLSATGSPVSPFKVVLLDLHMTELDGFDVAMRMRKFRSHSWPLIIALTASADEDLWDRCLQSGMNGVIRKPVLLKGIANELKRALLQANKVMSR